MRTTNNNDVAARIGGTLAALFMGGTLYCTALVLMEKIADALSAVLNAIIAVL